MESAVVTNASCTVDDPSNGVSQIVSDATSITLRGKQTVNDETETVLVDFSTGEATTLNPAYWTYTCEASNHVADQHYIMRTLGAGGIRTWGDESTMFYPYIALDYTFSSATHVETVFIQFS